MAAVAATTAAAFTAAGSIQKLQFANKYNHFIELLLKKLNPVHSPSVNPIMLLPLNF